MMNRIRVPPNVVVSIIRNAAFPIVTVRDRVRTKMERNILAEVNHPFIVKLHYGTPWHNNPPVHAKCLARALRRVLRKP